MSDHQNSKLCNLNEVFQWSVFWWAWSILYISYTFLLRLDLYCYILFEWNKIFNCFVSSKSVNCEFGNWLSYKQRLSSIFQYWLFISFSSCIYIHIKGEWRKWKSALLCQWKHEMQKCTIIMGANYHGSVFNDF